MTIVAVGPVHHALLLKCDRELESDSGTHAQPMGRIPVWDAPQVAIHLADIGQDRVSLIPMTVPGPELLRQLRTRGIEVIQATLHGAVQECSEIVLAAPSGLRQWVEFATWLSLEDIAQLVCSQPPALITYVDYVETMRVELVVRITEHAQATGARLVLINAGDTTIDQLARLVIALRGIEPGRCVVQFSGKGRYDASALEGLACGATVVVTNGGGPLQLCNGEGVSTVAFSSTPHGSGAFTVGAGALFSSNIIGLISEHDDLNPLITGEMLADAARLTVRGIAQGRLRQLVGE